LDVNWTKLKQQYLQGGLSIAELAKQHGINRRTLAVRATKDGWWKKRQQLHENVEAKMLATAVKGIEARASAWADEQFARCMKLREKITESMDQIGGPIDPLALDQLTKAEMRVDDMGRRSLGMTDPKKDEGRDGAEAISLDRFLAAVKSVDAMLAGHRDAASKLDVEKMSQEPIDV